jgi:hypothetical protein
VDYGFTIQDVVVTPGYQKLTAQYRQELSLSREAEQALEKGVALILIMDVELRDAGTLMKLAGNTDEYVIRYLPLSQHYQLAEPGGAAQIFPRRRHVLNRLARLRLELQTGPLAPGRYEYRARFRLDNARLPSPMHLPALFSADWQHDSEWSTWPFTIDV